MEAMQPEAIKPSTGAGVAVKYSSAFRRRLDSADLDELRNLRTEVRDLQRIINSVRVGESSLQDHVRYIKKTIGDIHALAPKLDAMERKHGGEDAIRHLRNVLERMDENPLLVSPEDTSRGSEDLLRYGTRLDELCQKFIYCVGVLTIPERVNEWLENSWPGYYIPFHAVFEEEMPVYEDRVRVLEHMAWTPRLIPYGIVDPTTGLIYKFSNRKFWLVASVALLAGVIAGVILGLQAAPNVFGNAFLTVESEPTVSLVVLWLAVVAGVAFHIIVGTAKQMRSNPDRPPIFAMRSVLPILNAKLGNILFKIALTIVGLVGLIFSIEANKINLLSAFLVGYSLDSVIELFGTSAEQMAAAQLASLKKQMGVADS
ncbi:MAG TPA: hypothetical protein VGD69_09850 [Herpetosiphonaceae bacterium]